MTAEGHVSNGRAHWDRVYGTKGDLDVSWFEPAPALSLDMIAGAGLTPSTCVIDVGGGNSRLVDALLDKGLRCITVLDVSGVVLASTKARLGTRGDDVTWIEADVTSDWFADPVDIWHDRALFHFLTDPDHRARYVARLRQTLKVGGHAIIATFASDGPTRCSGLPVTRYDPAALASELGPDFEFIEVRSHQHVTPWGATQSFQYSRLQRRG